jgi:hypothetical protein
MSPCSGRIQACSLTCQQSPSRLQTTSAEAEVAISTRLSVAKNAFVKVTFSPPSGISTRPQDQFPWGRAGNIPPRGRKDGVGQFPGPDLPFTHSRAKKRTAASIHVRGACACLQNQRGPVKPVPRESTGVRRPWRATMLDLLVREVSLEIVRALEGRADAHGRGFRTWPILVTPRPLIEPRPRDHT